LQGEPVREGVLTAVESVIGLDADFWAAFGDADAGERMQSGELRPDFHKRGFLRGYTDERYTFGRYFSPLDPNRPTDVESLFAHNDVVLYDRTTDPDELVNLAGDPAHDAIVAEVSAKLEGLITTEIGDDTNSWVLERPGLMGLPPWHGDQPTSRA
jgi:arylsulfatase